jgi:hypothetical protein
MTVYKSRKLLWASAAGLMACGVACVLAAVLLPYDARRARAGASASKHATASGATRGEPTLEAFEQVWDKPLRAPLVDAPPATQPSVAPAVASAPPPLFRLAGTIVEHGHNYALLITPNGQVDLKAVGEKSGAADVDAVTDGSVTLRIDGQLVTLEMPKPQ